MIRPVSRLSKSQIAQLLGCYFIKSGEINSRELRNGYFTDSVLAQLGINESEYNNIKRFSYEQSLKIIEIFHFDREDLIKINMQNVTS